MNKMLTRVVGPTIGATAVVMLVGAGLASAHVDPDPPAVEAGASATVGFGVEHGCEGSPTVEVQIELPATITDAAPVEKSGWDAVIDGGVLTFSRASCCSRRCRSAPTARSPGSKWPPRASQSPSIPHRR